MLMPVVVVLGARQVGKTTLVQHDCGNRKFYSLDDISILERAQKHPESLLQDLPVTIDEVQRAPELLLAIKHKVDKHRVPGSILLTGSANLLLMNRVSETLAGRAIYLELTPFCVNEWRQGNLLGAINALFEKKNYFSKLEVHTKDWKTNLLTGGFPNVFQFLVHLSLNDQGTLLPHFT